MRMATMVMDPGDASSGGGGVSSGNGGTLYNRKWMKISWSFPANAPTPDAFEVVAFTGTDPTDSTAYLFAPVKVLAADRSYITSFFPKSSLTINAAVRALYA